jgi:prophage DNA circulation protein
VSEDRWGDLLVEASYGGVRIDVTSADSDYSRSLAESKTAFRDGASYQDTGGEPWITTCQVVFLGDDHLERFQAFLAAKDQARPLLFMHPLFGAHYCRVSECRASVAAEPRDTIVLSVTFHEDADAHVIATSDAEISIDAGVENVRVIGGEVDDSLLEMGLAERDATGALVPATGVSTASATVGPTALDVVSNWSRMGRTATRDAAQQLGAVNNAIDRAESDFKVATDLKMYPLARQLVRLRASVRRTYVAFASSTARLIEIRVTKSQPVLTIAARIYGARDAQVRAQELVELNRLRNPARVEQGTVLRAHSPRRAPVYARRTA